MVAIGEKFGRLTVVASAEPDARGRPRWQCACVCGGSTVTRSDGLKSGHVQSCGCRQKEAVAKICKDRATHGLSRSRIHDSWCHMISRCRNPKDGRFSDYGERGISVCERWQTFENFHADMGDMPEGRTLERRDNSKGYSPDNCYWATYSEQNKNRRGFLSIPVDGKLLIIGAYAKRHGVTRDWVKQQISEGSIVAVRRGGVSL